MVLSPADRVELHELFARYAYCIDTCDWPGLVDIFTADAEFTVDVLNVHMRGVDEIIHFMAEVADHPVAHHITNVFADATADGAVSHGRLMGVGRNGRVSTGHYRDEVVRTADGWRVRRRSFTMTNPRPE